MTTRSKLNGDCTVRTLAREVLAGDTIVTFDTAWQVGRVDHCAAGIRIHCNEFPFPWLFGGAELVTVQRGEPA